MKSVRSTCSRTDLFTVRMNKCNMLKSYKVFDLFSCSPKGGVHL